MKSKLMVLAKNDSWKKHEKKLLEEFLEALEVMKLKDNKRIIEEVLDVVQVCIGIIDKLDEEGIDIRQAILKHEKKLIDRGWKSKREIEVKF